MFNINGYQWEVYMVNPHHPMLMRQDGSYSIGACDSKTQAIYLNDKVDKNFLKKVLCHEIVHASIFSYKIELSVEDEEFIADLIAKHGEEIIRLTNRLFNKFKK